MYIRKKDIKLKKHRKHSHKGDHGRLLIIGGSIDFVGAPILAGLGAFATGVDLVIVAAPSKVAWAINCFNSDFITKKFKGDYFSLSHAKEIIKLSNKMDVILIGNGLGQTKTTMAFARKVCKIKKPKVIDADAVKAVRLQDVDNAILTPHQREFEILLENSKLKPEKLKKHLGTNVILLKGQADKIISAKKTILNKTGNEGMTVGGTGDILAGLAAGFLAQGYPLFKAASYAAFLNGYVGDLIYKQKGVALTASDIADALPYEMRRFY